MTQTVIHGSNVNVLVDINDIWTYIGCATGCAFEFENEIILKTDRNAGLFRKKRARISDTRSSVSGVMTSGANTERASIFYFLQEGVRRRELNFQFLYIDDAGNDVSILQTAIVQAISLNADVSNFAEFDMQLEGTGNFEQSIIVPPSGTPTCEQEPTIYAELTADSATYSNALLIPAVGETITILHVSRSGATYYETSGTPGNLEFQYTTGTGTITFLLTGNPANPDLEPISIEYKIEI